MKYWTKKEERILIREVSKHANNIQEGLRIASKKTKRTLSGCQYKWYNEISKKQKTTICFATVGRKTKNINRKIVHTNTSDNTEAVEAKDWWSKLKKLIKL